MGFLDKLFGGREKEETNVQYVYARCAGCDEVLRGRFHLTHDLSAEYEGRDVSYFARKTLIGSGRCFRPIEIELRFNHKRRLVDKTIRGGEFITREEYEADSH